MRLKSYNHMKIKKGDKVMVIAGKDRGKTGAIHRALPKENMVIIEGINVVKRHERASQNARKGQIVEKAMPIHVSNVQILDPKSGKPTRVRIVHENGKYARVAQKSGARLS